MHVDLDTHYYREDCLECLLQVLSELCVGRSTSLLRENTSLDKASGCMLNHPFPTDPNFLLSKVAVHDIYACRC